MSETRAPWYPVSLRPGADLDEQLGTRGEQRGAVMKRDLLRYYRLLERELARVEFTPLEVDALVAAIEGLHAGGDDPLAGPLWAFVDEWLSEHPAVARRRLNAGALVRKLRALTPGATLAVVDAVERFLRSPMGRTPDAPMRRDALEAVGLLRANGPSVGRYRKTAHG